MPSFALDVRRQFHDKPTRIYLKSASARAAFEEAQAEGYIVDSCHPFDENGVRPEAPQQDQPLPPPMFPRPQEYPTRVVIHKIDISPSLETLVRLTIVYPFIFAGGLFAVGFLASIIFKNR